MTALIQSETVRESIREINRDRAEKIYRQIRAYLCQSLTSCVRNLAPEISRQLIATVRAADNQRDAKFYATGARAFVTQNGLFATEAGEQLGAMADVMFDLSWPKFGHVGNTNKNARSVTEMFEPRNVEEGIFVQDLADRIRMEGGQVYLDFLHRIMSLQGMEVKPAELVHENKLLLAAPQIAVAIVRAYQPVSESARVRFALRRMLVQGLALELAEAYLEADRMLAEAGVTTLGGVIDTEVRFARNMTVERSERVSYDDAKVRSANYLADLPSSEEWEIDGLAPGTLIELGPEVAREPEPSSNAKAGGISSSVVAETLRKIGAPTVAGTSAALTRLAANTKSVISAKKLLDIGDPRAFALNLGLSPYSRAARMAWFNAVQEMCADDIQPVDREVIKYLSAVFDYAIEDGQLSDQSRMFVWHLLKPLLTIALLDRSAVGQHDHSVAKILEAAVSILSVYGRDPATEVKLFKNFQSLIESLNAAAEVLEERAQGLTTNDAVDAKTRSLRQILATLATLKDGAGHASNERRHNATRPGPAQEQQATQYIQYLLAQRLQQGAVSADTQAFLKMYWLRHLRTCYLRDGVDSSEFKIALRVVDELVGIFGRRPGDSRQLSEVLPPLMHDLSQGISSVGARPEDVQSFMDQLIDAEVRRHQAGARFDRRLSVARASPVMLRDRRGEGRVAALHRDVELDPSQKSLTVNFGIQDQLRDAVRPEDVRAFRERFQAMVLTPNGRAARLASKSVFDALVNTRLDEQPELGELVRSPDLTRMHIQVGSWMLMEAPEETPKYVKFSWIAPDQSHVVVLPERTPSRPQSPPIILNWGDLHEMISLGQLSVVRL